MVSKKSKKEVKKGTAPGKTEADLSIGDLVSGLLMILGLFCIGCIMYALIFNQENQGIYNGWDPQKNETFDEWLKHSTYGREGMAHWHIYFIDKYEKMYAENRDRALNPEKWAKIDAEKTPFYIQILMVALFCFLTYGTFVAIKNIVCLFKYTIEKCKKWRQDKQRKEMYESLA